MNMMSLVRGGIAREGWSQGRGGVKGGVGVNTP